MSRPRTTIARALSALLAVGLIVSSPAPAFAGSPPDGSTPVPAALPNAPITLDDGTVLPLPPSSWLREPSVQARMDAEHSTGDFSFTPGERPTVPLVGQGALQPVVGPTATAASGPIATAFPNGLRKEVLGFLPYWMLDASDLQWMQYQLVSTIAFFGVAARSDGTLATYAAGWPAWYSSAMTGVINAAHARGVKVVLTITMMAYDGGAQQAALLGNPTARANVIAAIVAAVRDRNADGVNLDFEPVAVAQRDQYTSFVRQLKAALVAAGVGSHVTVCTMAGAATWATGYDLAGLVAPGAADALFVMGYDYSWSGSARAGGVAPMSSPYMLDVNESVSDYLRVVPASRLIWGVPYYGRAWRTQTSNLNSPTQPGASATSVAYWYTGNLSLAAQYGRLWDPVGQVPWFRYFDSGAGSWVQGYYDDAASLGAKWDMVNQRGLLGTGMWTLLMDAGRQELWNLLAAKFVQDTSPPTGGITVLPSQTDASAILVSWRAVDVGSGLLSYSVQARDRASSTWTAWWTDTNVTSAYWLGQPGHTYEFRMSAVDRNGNRQPWTAAAPDPGANLVVGGFAEAAVDALNVRTGAGTTFGVIDTLELGARVAVLGGPIAAGGYDWYQVQFDFTEWTSVDYPRIGWAAAAGGGTPYLRPAVGPTVTSLLPWVTGYQAAPRRFSPNGDGVADQVTASFSLTGAASSARLDVLDAAGATVATSALGPLAAGPQTAVWDGHVTGGAWAPAGEYLLRIVATDAGGDHPAPTMGVNATILGAWGVTADLTAPSVAASSPTGDLASPITNVTVTFSEAVAPSGSYLSLVDTTTGSAVPAAVTIDGAARQVTLDPAAELVLDRTYRVDVDPSVRDAAGNPVGPAGFTFSTAPAATYVPLNPSRILDTRVGTGLAGPFSANTPRTFQVTGQGGVPTSAVAVTGTLTVTGQSRAGYLYLGPTPLANPPSSTMNFPLGDTRATAVTVALGPGGTLSATYLAPAGSTTGLIFDVTGYFVVLP
ncbi:MAG TPA: glycosyl hydrolase family 18 protein [Candidatus Limnocylindria bacterium]